ncbi:Nif3-like dinuclear metal center hexameric protein [Desulfovibrio sp. OttesenSCG-928-F20]|nr:Nif3-like dinuclear metal center hexameric protein [Desulfovibrio sp. OttesenSCG-928-F20]
MKASEIIAIIEKHAAPDLAAPWDASGIQVAGLRPDVRRLAVMLDPTLENLTCAAEDGADFILAHHPLSMKPRFPNRVDCYLSILSLLLSRGIWLYSAHTSLDAAPEGPARWLADALNLACVSTLDVTSGNDNLGSVPGFGFVGSLPEPLPYADFCRQLAGALGCRAWQACGPCPDTVSTVACCPGSGSSLIETALAKRADIFITGDVKYHAALDASVLGLRVLDVGHFILEEEMMRRFSESLAHALSIPLQFYPSCDPLVSERFDPSTTAPEEDAP